MAIATRSPSGLPSRGSRTRCAGHPDRRCVTPCAESVTRSRLPSSIGECAAKTDHLAEGKSVSALFSKAPEGHHFSVSIARVLGRWEGGPTQTLLETWMTTDVDK